MESSPPHTRPELGTGYEVLDHLQRVITKTPGAESSILSILGDDPFENGGRDCAHTCGYSTESSSIGESSTGDAFLDEMQSVWCSKLIECLRDTAKQFGLPLCRKRTIGEQELVESRWFDLGSEEIELLAAEPLYTPQDLLDFLLSAVSTEDNTCSTSGNISLLAQASVVLKTKDICELREMLKMPDYEAPLPQDLDSAEYELFAQLIYDTSDQLAAREFLKRGCPHCMRRLFWARVLGVSSPEKVNAEFEELKERVIRYELLVDQIIIKDVRDNVMNDVEYFAFDDSCYQVMLAFTRDYCVSRRIRSHSLRSVAIKSDLPCGAVPHYGFSLLVSPLCFMYAEVGIMYAVFREMYCRYFHKLMAISSDPQMLVSLEETFEKLSVAGVRAVYHGNRIGDYKQVPTELVTATFAGSTVYVPDAALAVVRLPTKKWDGVRASVDMTSHYGIVSLLLTFERLVQYREPEFLPALASKNVNLQPIVFQMLMQSFCAHLPVEEVLRLWDRILGYDSVYVLPVAAASLVCSKKTEILGMKDQSSLEDMFNKLQPCDVISTLEEFLKPPNL